METGNRLGRTGSAHEEKHITRGHLDMHSVLEHRLVVQSVGRQRQVGAMRPGKYNLRRGRGCSPSARLDNKQGLRSAHKASVLRPDVCELPCDVDLRREQAAVDREAPHHRMRSGKVLERVRVESPAVQ